MSIEPTEAKKDALAFLERHKTGVLATAALSGAPHASLVYYTADEDFNIYFLTQASSRKFMTIGENPRVAFTVSTPDVPQTLQLEGVARDITEDAEASKKRDALFEVLNSNPWFYAPISKLDPADTVVVWIKPSFVRWADYAFEENGSKNVFTEITL